MATTLSLPSIEQHVPSSVSSTARFVASTIATETSAPQYIDIEPAELVRWFVRNKLPLLAIVDEPPPSIRDHPAFAAALDAERDWYETQRGKYLIARDAWWRRGIPCLMIKSAGNHPAFPHTSDNIDILVRPEHGRAARDTLRAIGYVEVRNVEEPQKYLFRRFHNGRCVSAIHVHEQIAWFVGFLNDSEVWQRSRAADDDPQVTIPSPEDAILINLAHACYENKELRLNDVLRVRHAMQSSGHELDWDYLHRIAVERGWADGLAFLLLVQSEVESSLFGETLIPERRLRWLESLIARDAPVQKQLARIRVMGVRDLPLDLSYLFCKRLYYRKIMADPQRTARQRIADAARTLIWGVKLKSRIRPQSGFVVSISGTDGSGKTTHATALVDALRLCELKVDYSWSRGGSGGVLAALGRAWKRRPARATPRSTETDDPIERRREKLAHPVIRFTWAWLVALDQLGTSYRRVSWPAFRGRIVVTDRYIYDTAVEMDASLPDDARWSRLAIAAMLRLAPRPDIGIVLDASLPTAQQRKPYEAWHASFDRERRLYQTLAGQHGLWLVSVEGEFADSNDRLIEETIMSYMRQFATHLNALFLSNPQQRNVPDPIWAEGGTR